MTVPPDIKKISPANRWIIRAKQVLRSMGIASLITVLVYFLVMYVNVGYIYLPNKHTLLELFAAFTFILGLLWMNRLLSGWLPGLLRKLHPIQGLIFEIVIVILASLMVFAIFHVLPLFIFFSYNAFSPLPFRIGMVVSLILALFLYFFIERERQRKRLQEEQLRSSQLQKESYQAQLQHLKNQVNPHFLFNSLNVLGALIELQPEKASVFNQKLSDMYRIFLERSDQELVSLKQELELVEAYIYLLKTRFGNTLEIDIQLPGHALDKLLPPGGLQTLLENAVKHNGSTKREPLKIQVFVKEDLLQVQNQLRPRTFKGLSSGKGLENLQNRYRYLSNQQPEFHKTSTHFLAKLPLLDLEEESERNSAL